MNVVADTHLNDWFTREGIDRLCTIAGDMLASVTVLLDARRAQGRQLVRPCVRLHIWTSDEGEAYAASPLDLDGKVQLSGHFDFPTSLVQPRMRGRRTSLDVMNIRTTLFKDIDTENWGEVVAPGSSPA